jgi:hypothetical protein
MRRHLVLEHLVHLLECSIPCLGEKEDGKEDEQAVCAKPNVAVFGAPAEFGGVDKIWCCERSKPVTNEV